MLELEQARVVLGRRLQERRPELEAAAIARLRFSGSVLGTRATSAAVSRETVSAAVAYGLAAIELGEKYAPPAPPTLLKQARAAAQRQVSLDLVLRNYVAGYSLIWCFVFQEAELCNLRGSALENLFIEQTVVFDQLLESITTEYGQAAETQHLTVAEARLLDSVECLLAGKPVDKGLIDYNFDLQHLGVIAVGSEAVPVLRSLPQKIRQPALCVPKIESEAWAWIRCESVLQVNKIVQILEQSCKGGVKFALGEPQGGIKGWKETHRQAQALLPFLGRYGQSVIRYREVAFDISVLQDDLFVGFLTKRYLEPLENDSDRGAKARETLQAYLAADRNVSSAAADLGVSPPTVRSRLRKIEAKLGEPLLGSLIELEAALRLVPQ